MPQRKSSSIDRAWAEAFRTAIFRAKQPQGEGWKTFEELKDEFKYGKNRTHNLLAILIKEGRLDKFEGTVHNGKRGVRQVWYRPKV